MSLRVRGLLLLGISLVAAGCAGESARLPAITAGGAGANAPTLKASVRFFVPNRIGNETARGHKLNRRSRGRLHQLFIAANTAGIKLFVYPAGTRTGALAQLVGDISSASPQCTPVTNGRACSFTVTVPAGGPYDFVVSTFDAAPVGGVIPGSANQLGAAVDTTTIAVGKANAVAISVGGVVATTFVIVPRPGLFHAIASTTQQITIGALDRDGNLIATDGYVDPAGDPLTIAPSSNAGSAIAFTPPSFAAPQANGVTLKYDAIHATSAQVQNGIDATLSAPGSGVVAGTAELQIQPFIVTGISTGSGPEEVALNGGWQYVTDVTGNEVQVFAFTTLNISQPSGNPNGIAAGPGGSVWITWSGANGIQKLEQAGGSLSIGSFISLPGTGPIRIAAGPDGAMWFSEFTANAIGRISSSGVVTSYPLPTANAGPQGITAGPDGAVWFAECHTGKIGRIPVDATPGSSAQITEYASLTSGALSYPFGIVAGADGALWFTETGQDRIGRITTNGVVTEIPAPQETSEIASGPDGALWFTEENSSKIGRILTSATPATPGIIEFTTPDSSSNPVGIAVDADGSLYYTENAVDKLIHMR
jgi:virginiamycin B lyase